MFQPNDNGTSSSEHASDLTSDEDDDLSDIIDDDSIKSFLRQ
jgi:hypothetical protein